MYSKIIEITTINIVILYSIILYKLIESHFAFSFFVWLMSSSPLIRASSETGSPSLSQKIKRKKKSEVNLAGIGKSNSTQSLTAVESVTQAELQVWSVYCFAIKLTLYIESIRRHTTEIKSNRSSTSFDWQRTESWESFANARATATPTRWNWNAVAIDGRSFGNSPSQIFFVSGCWLSALENRRQLHQQNNTRAKGN